MSFLTISVREPNEILQLINLLIKGTTRLDADRLTRNDIDEFNNTQALIKQPLLDFFDFFKNTYKLPVV